MNLIARTALILLIALVGLIFAAGFFHYHLRLRTVVGDPVVLEFDKLASAGCLPHATLSGRIDKLELDGVVFTDTSGSIGQPVVQPAAQPVGHPQSQADQSGNTLHMANSKLACPDLGLVVLDEKTRQYFVPFHSLAGMRKNQDWHWSNPFQA